MVKHVKSVSIFISSPSELTDEREIAAETCRKLTSLRNSSDGVRIEPITWETHVRPTAGEGPQDSINQQIGDSYDIFVGFLGNRFGIETSNAGSGTEEEFDRAYDRWLAKENIEILFYFRDPKTAPGTLSANQLIKVEGFKDKLKDKGFIYWDYSSSDEFESLLLQHLNTAVDAVLEKETTQVSIPSDQNEAAKPSVETDSTTDPLANLNSLTEEAEDEGYIELAEVVEYEFNSLVSLTNQITEDLEILTTAFTKSTDRIQAITVADGGGSRNHTKKIINDTASKMETYIEGVASKLPAINKHFSKGIDAAGRTVLLAKLEHDYAEEAAEQFTATFSEFSTAISGASDNITEFNSSIEGFPRATSKMNRAKRRMLAINNDLIAFFNSVDRQIQNLLNEL